MLRSVEGLTLGCRALKSAAVSRTFCIKYPEISNKMVGEKTADIARTGADTLLAGDMGCLLNMAGKLKREGRRSGCGTSPRFWPT